MQTVILENYIAEAAAAAAMDFAASALNSAVHKIIQESGGISREEVNTIANLYEKIIHEAMDEFVPSDEEIQDLIAKLEAAGYKVVKAEEVKAEEAPESDEAAKEDVVNESADLATKIAAKLQIL
jgi:hypothetical protein